MRRDFRRGNINFDFLQPEGEAQAVASQAEPFVERRGAQREGKRGLFNRGRSPRPITRWHFFGWGASLALSIGLGLWIVIWRPSLLWYLLLPMVMAGGFWSLIMLALFKARPR